ncbi:MAG: hypothetical protein IPL49_09690 [Saprospirales bacterium]|nr:hypothetical protein [Saprospirales bacterium]MBK8491138.1 hypothetical protein [Saprospirales bacterium]
MNSLSAKVFFQQLGLITFLTAAVLFILNQYPLFGDHQLLYWMLLGFYFLTAILLYVVGKKLAVSENKNAFTLFVMGSVFAKMLLSMVVLVLYLKFAEPASKYFILPFFVVYLAFTIFETYFLMKIGRVQPVSGYGKAEDRRQ